MQEAQLSQRDRATRMSVEILSLLHKCTTNCIWKGLQ